MSVSFGCHCEERKKPIMKRAWRVTKRNFNTSAFNGYHRTDSDYSSVVCLTCSAVGRTKADYVCCLKDIKPGEGGY
jgi:hypothetical protein